MEQISKYQLFTLTIFFQIGTTIIFGFGASTGKDAWIVSLLSTVIGLLMIGVYLILFYMHPNLTLVEWYTTQFGKWIGTPIAWLYPILFLYEAARVINDIKFLITYTILTYTPLGVVIISFILLVAYIQYCGIKVLCRLGELFLPLFLSLFILEIILLLGSGEMKGKNLQPFLCNGWEPILKASWPLGASQGFTQILYFSMIWPLVNSYKDVPKTTVISTILSGLIITIGNIIAITNLGEIIFQDELFPLYIVLRKMNIGDLIKNFDALGILYFTVLAFFKISLHMFFAIRSIQRLTYMKNERKLILPLTILSIYLGYSLASNFLEHIKVGLVIFPYNLWIPLLWIFPILLLIVSLIRKTLKKEKFFQNI